MEGALKFKGLLRARLFRILLLRVADSYSKIFISDIRV